MAEEKKSNKLILIVIILMVILLVAAGVIIALLVTGGNNETSSEIYNSETGFGYEVTASLITSGEIAFSQPEGVAVRFSPYASSTDGLNFKCEIGNSLANTLDMYIEIYADMQAQDKVYGSGLMRPGEGITSFKALHEMPKGSYDVVLVLTLVEDDHKTIHNQSTVALILSVD